MERVKALINSLQEQVQRNASPETLLATIQQIQSALAGLADAPQRHLGTAKVAVMMPANHPYSRPVPREEEVAVLAGIPEDLKKTHEKNYQHPVRKDDSNGWLFDPVRETPTLAQQGNVREINDVVGTNGTSLNDRLKTGHTELAAVLTDTPIRDLKKAIGINDRYVFLNELFRGDEAMYERSLKTINSFRILPEAEYWIERELKVKLGWDDGKTTTQHFYQLVKRRFS
jgi:hypothetical protein